MDASEIDVETMSGEEYARLVKDLKDDEQLALVRELGFERVLDRVFSTFPERFKGGDGEGSVLFRIKDGDAVAEHAIVVSGGSCRHEKGRMEDPTSTVTTDYVTFSKLVTGQANETMLFIRGKLKIGDNVMFAQKFLTWFDRPKA